MKGRFFRTKRASFHFPKITHSRGPANSENRGARAENAPNRLFFDNTKDEIFCPLSSFLESPVLLVLKRLRNVGDVEACQSLDFRQSAAVVFPICLVRSGRGCRVLTESFSVSRVVAIF